MKWSENLIPKMTGYNIPNGQVVYSGNYVETIGFLAWNAFDGVIGIDGSRWASSVSGTKYIGYKFNESKKISKYAIYGEFYNVGSQSPKSWNLEASNNGKFSYNGGVLNVDYWVLDTQSNQTNWTSCEKREFIIDNAQDYLYYVITNLIAVGGSAVSISEIQMFERINNNRFLIKQDTNYIAIKSEFYKHLGQPLTDTERNEWFEKYGSDDLSILTKEFDKNTEIGIDKGSIGNGKYFEIPFNNNFLSVSELK